MKTQQIFSIIWIYGDMSGGVDYTHYTLQSVCVCMILTPICLLHDTLSFDLNIVVPLDK